VLLSGVERRSGNHEDACAQTSHVPRASILHLSVRPDQRFVHICVPSVAKGIEIIEGLRGHTTGYAVPQFVIDAPGGGWQWYPSIPVTFFITTTRKSSSGITNGKIFEYPETGNEQVQFAPQREYHDEYLYS